MLKNLLSVIISCCFYRQLAASPKTRESVIAAVEKAMGGATLKSIEYSGIGSNANLGQGVNPTARLAPFRCHVLFPHH